MKKVAIITFLLFLFICGICSAEERWHFITSTTYSDFSFDTQTIQINKGKGFTMYDVWTKRIFSNEGVLEEMKSRMDRHILIGGYVNLSYSLIHEKILNSPAKDIILEVVYYDKSGNVLDDIKNITPDEKWADIKPDSVGEKIINALNSFSMDKDLNAI